LYRCAEGAAAGGGGWGKKQGHGETAREAHHLFARRANEFTTIREFATTAECVRSLREDGRTIWATDLSQHAVCLTERDLRAAAAATATTTATTSSSSSSSSSVIPEKLAIVFGTESVVGLHSLPGVGTFLHVIVVRQNTVQLMTAGMEVRVTNLTPPGSECNPS
jgi:hypothetical protein